LSLSPAPGSSGSSGSSSGSSGSARSASSLSSSTSSPSASSSPSPSAGRGSSLHGGPGESVVATEVYPWLREAIADDDTLRRLSLEAFSDDIFRLAARFRLIVDAHVSVFAPFYEDIFAGIVAEGSGQK
jgi:hypothetical protein